MSGQRSAVSKRPICRRPFEARESGVYAAIILKPGEAENQIERAVLCTQCGTVIVPGGVLVDRKPDIPIRCKTCKKILTQPYAQERRECLECLQYRLRHGRDQKWFFTQQKRETRREERLREAELLQAELLA